MRTKALLLTVVFGVLATAELRAQDMAPAVEVSPPDSVDNAKSLRISALRRTILEPPTGETLIHRSSGPRANVAAAPPQVHRAFFCRFDDDLDRKRIPLRMRLGDLETVNKKESKPGW